MTHQLLNRTRNSQEIVEHDSWSACEIWSSQSGVAVGEVIPSVLKDCRAFIFRIKQLKKEWLLDPDPEGRGTMILWNVRNYSPKQTSSHPTRLECSFHYNLWRSLSVGSIMSKIIVVYTPIPYFSKIRLSIILWTWPHFPHRYKHGDMNCESCG